MCVWFVLLLLLFFVFVFSQQGKVTKVMFSRTLSQNRRRLGKTQPVEGLWEAEKRLKPLSLRFLRPLRAHF